MEKIYFAKVREGAIIPSKKDEDAGYDLYACFDESTIVIPPHQTVMIPTGIATAFSEKYYAQFQERGSTGTKGMKYGAGVIDSGYRGEWRVPISNVNDVPLVISKLDKEDIDVILKNYIYYPANKAVVQFVMLEVPKFETVEISFEELSNIKSERGTGSLGSSGK